MPDTKNKDTIEQVGNVQIMRFNPTGTLLVVDVNHNGKFDDPADSSILWSNDGNALLVGGKCRNALLKLESPQSKSNVELGHLAPRMIQERCSGQSVIIPR